MLLFVLQRVNLEADTLCVQPQELSASVLHFFRQPDSFFQKEMFSKS